jgi:hypothetical protein
MTPVATGLDGRPSPEKRVLTELIDHTRSSRVDDVGAAVRCAPARTLLSVAIRSWGVDFPDARRFVAQMAPAACDRKFARSIQDDVRPSARLTLTFGDAADRWTTHGRASRLTTGGLVQVAH